MIDDTRISDADLARLVARHSPHLAGLVEARLRALRLKCIVSPPPPKPDNPLHILRRMRGRAFPGK